MDTPDYISWFVDRAKQNRRFREMLANKTPMSVMLIAAPAAMGKSFLIKKMSYLAEEAGRPFVLVDFRERRAHDTLWLVRYTRDQLSRLVDPRLFNDLTATINQHTTGLAEIAPLRPAAKPLLLTIKEQQLNVEIDLVEIRNHLNRFNESEIRTLTFDLGIKFDDLAGSNLAARIVDLISICEKYQILDQLIIIGSEELPHLAWWREITPAGVGDVGIEGASAATGPAGELPVVDNFGELRAAGAQARALALSQINLAFFSCLRQVLDQHQLVFLFDSFEDATDEAEDWIRDNLLIPLFDGRYDNLLIVIAGRQIADVGDRKPLVGRTSLDPFTVEHVREYLLEKRQIQEDDIEKIYNYCRGFPGILATMADAYTSSSESDDDW